MSRFADPVEWSADRASGMGPASLVVAGLAGASALVLFLADRLPEGLVGMVSDVVYQLVAIGAGVVTILAARPLGRRERLVWSAIGAGLLAAAAGDIVWTLQAVGGVEPPYPGLPDVFYLAAYPLWFVAILAMPYAHGSRYRQARLALDAVVATTTLAGTAWMMVFADLVTLDGPSAMEVAVSAAYPLMDALLVAALVVLVLRGRGRGHLRVLFLTIALAVTAVADLVYLGAFESYTAGGWLDGLWVLGYGLFALAAHDLTRPPVPERPAHRAEVIDESRFSYLLFGALVIASGVAVLSDPAIRATSKTLLLVTGVVAVAVVVRISLGIAESRSVLERERREMIASVSHELRTPLTAIQGFVDLIAEAGIGLDEGERAEMLATVQGQTRGLSRIVSDLIEVSRDQLTSDRLQPVEFRLAGAVDDAVAASAVRADVSVDVGDCLMVADRQRLVQVIVNLVTNAARYGHGRIRVVAGPVGDEVSIAVHDDGPGVPARYRELIWERFERGPQRGSSTAGTGIGLALVRALVEAHGGRVAYAESGLMGGACFLVTVPIGVAAASAGALSHA